MGDKRGSGLVLVAVVLVVLVLLALVVGCCGGGLALTFLAPTAMVAALIEGEALPVAMPAADPVATVAARVRICDALAAGQPASMTGEELTRLVNEVGMDGLEVFNVAFDADRGELDLSLRPDPAEPQYFNFHLAGTFTMERGWVTVSTIDELRASGWELGPYIAGEDLVDDFNRSLANERADSPELFEVLDSFETIAIRDGGLALVPLGPTSSFPICSP